MDDTSSRNRRESLSSARGKIPHRNSFSSVVSSLEQVIDAIEWTDNNSEMSTLSMYDSTMGNNTHRLFDSLLPRPGCGLVHQMNIFRGRIRPLLSLRSFSSEDGITINWKQLDCIADQAQ